MRDDPRSVMGGQFQITLPALWRNGHEIDKGDVVKAHYNRKSVLIVSGRELLPLEEDLIDILLSIPEFVNTKELAVKIKKFVETIIEMP